MFFKTTVFFQAILVKSMDKIYVCSFLFDVLYSVKVVQLLFKNHNLKYLFQLYLLLFHLIKRILFSSFH